jgi:tetratricopeptide (TPR) repeat protein
LKGCDHAELGEMDGAIDSFRHAISLDQAHAEAMHNLAAQYEAQQRFSVAVKWYKIALTVKPGLLDAYYGYALCQFKDGRPQDAAEYLSIAIVALEDVDIKKRAQRHKIYFRYLRALCYRVLQDFERSQEDYRSLLRAFELEEGTKFAKYIFAMILMPVETDRKRL